MCVQHPRKQPQSNVCSTCRPTPLQSLLVHSFSTPVNKNHCAFHPSATTIAISACAFQSVHSTQRQSTRCNQWVCVQHPRQQPQFTVCSTWRNQNLRFLFLQRQSPTSSQSVLVDSMVCIPLCASILFVLPARQSHQCNQCLCVLHSRQQPQTTEFSTCRQLTVAISACVCVYVCLCLCLCLCVCPTRVRNCRVYPCGITPMQSVPVRPTSASESSAQSVLHLVISIPAPVGKNHGEFHPRAIVHAILCISPTVNHAIAFSACVSCIRISNHSPWSLASSCPSLRHMAQRLWAPMQCELMVVSYLVIFPTLRSQLFSLIHPLKLCPAATFVQN